MQLIFNMILTALSVAVLVVVAVRELAWSRRYERARDAEATALSARIAAAESLTSPKVKEHFDAMKAMLEQSVAQLSSQKDSATSAVAQLQYGLTYTHLATLWLAANDRARAATLGFVGDFALRYAKEHSILAQPLADVIKGGTDRQATDMILQAVSQVVEKLGKQGALPPGYNEMVEKASSRITKEAHEIEQVALGH